MVEAHSTAVQCQHRHESGSTGLHGTISRELITIIIIINLIYIARFDTNAILTALYIVIAYIQMQYVHV